MSNYISGKDLLAYWDIEDFELLDCLKKGLQPYTSHGQKIIDTDTLEHGRELPLEWYIARVRASNMPTAVEPGAGYRTSGRYVPLTEQEIQQRAKKDYESQPLKPIDPPLHCISFTLSPDWEKAGKVIRGIQYFLFKKDEVNEFAKKHGHPRVEAPHGALLEKAESQSYEDIIKGMILQYENDESFTIKSESGDKKTFRYDDRDLNFKNSKTKEWACFSRFLKSKQPVKVNDQERRRMRKVEDKLKNLMKNLNHIDIPKDYELFYHDPTDKRGCYRTRFNTSLSPREITFTNKDDFIDQFTELLALIKTKKVDVSTEATFLEYLELGKQNKYLNDAMYNKALKSFNIASTRHGEIERIPSETAIKNDPNLL